jgi:hypothetical protein
MTQQSMFFDGIEEAAQEIARHYPDGPKALALRLRPTKSVTSAYTWWLDCCNVKRTEHNFAGEDWLALIKIGREINCHAVLHYICDQANYARTQPIEPEDELTGLLREYSARKRLDVRDERRIESLIERLQGSKK